MDDAYPPSLENRLNGDDKAELKEFTSLTNGDIDEYEKEQEDELVAEYPEVIPGKKLRDFIPIFLFLYFRSCIFVPIHCIFVPVLSFLYFRSRIFIPVHYVHVAYMCLLNILILKALNFDPSITSMLVFSFSCFNF